MVLFVVSVFDVAVVCGVAVSASGVIVGGAFSFEDIRPLQPVRIIISKLRITQVTDVPGDLLFECSTSLLASEKEKCINANPTHAEMNTNINATIIVKYALSFQAALSTA